MFNFKKAIPMLVIIFGVCGLLFTANAQAETGNPDLTVTEIKFTAPEMKKGVDGTIFVTIKNLGGDLTSGKGLTNTYFNLTSQNFKFNAVTPSITAYQTSRELPTASNPLKNNESITFSWVGNFNTSGNVYLNYKVDNANELDESNENNNTLSKTITINAAIPVKVNLIVLKRGNGGGKVIGVDQDGKEIINCGSVCKVEVLKGIATTFTATADSGSTFSGWSDLYDNSNDDTLSVSVSSNFTKTIDGEKVIYAKFQLISIPEVPAVDILDRSIPRVMFWPGKVNQHWNLSTGAWETDTDGVSGSRENKLEYCQKFYPTTVKVVEYKKETINNWRARYNLGQYIGTTMSYRCVLSGEVVDGADVSNKAEIPNQNSICYYYPNAYLCRPFNNSDNLSDTAKAKAKAITVTTNTTASTTATTSAATSTIISTSTVVSVATSTSSQTANRGTVISNIAKNLSGSQLVLTLQKKISELTKRVLELEDQLTKLDANFAAKSAGTMFLDVQNKGRLWYVDPASKNRFYFENGEAALNIGSKLALGISAENLKKIPVGVPEKLYNLKDTDGDGLPDRLETAIGSDHTKSDTDGDGRSDKEELVSGYDPSSGVKYVYDEALAKRLEGKLLLQAGGANAHGEIWYVHDGKRWYGGTEDSMYEIMKAKSLGATAEDIRKITVGEVEN